MLFLPTKLFPPPLSSHQVTRDRLLRQLARGKPRALTLISAPAGFGKSTLLAEWMARGQANGDFRGGWLSLDAGENAPAQFWGYLVAAWKSSLPNGVEQPDDLLERFDLLLKADETRIAEGVVPLVVQLMLSERGASLLALDDYHQIHNPEIHLALGQLIERLPEHIHLAIATRADPPLPIPRLRVREQLTEIRAADLRFTGDEIDQLFQQIPGIAYSPADRAIIEASTEGWAAGLKMAGLALRAQERTAEETRRFWEGFNGRNIYVLDYLTEEVLRNLPAETQIFLIRTAILDRLNEGLCAAVAFADANLVDQARAALDYLHRSNLFLIALDQERCWFRYHHLFADLLRVRLQQQFGEEIPALHRRAAGWYEQAGWIDEAMRHSIAAQDWERAARMVEQYANDYLDRGQLATVLHWVEALPEELLRRRPNLCIQMTWALAHAGRTHLVGPMLREASAALALWEQQREGVPVDPPLDFTERDMARVRAGLAVFRAYALILASKPDQALEIARTALEPPGNLEPRESAWLHWVSGYACRGMGEIEQATRFFQKAVAIGAASGMVWEDHSTDLGIVYRLSGRLENAAQVFEEALRRGEQSGLRNKGNLSRVEAYLSAVRMEQDRVNEALEHARKAVAYLQWWPSHNHISTAYGFSSLAWLAVGDLQQARAALEVADQEHRKGEVTPFVTRLIEQAWVRLWIAERDWARLKGWADSQAVQLPGDPLGQPFNEYEETRLISLCRAWVALGRCETGPGLLQAAVPVLTVLAASAGASKRAHASIEIRLLGAEARWELSLRGQGGSVEALEWLSHSLREGLPNGYRRVYLSEGKGLRDLLAAWLGKGRDWIEASGVSLTAARDLLQQMGEPPDRPRAADLVEPLTEREKDVLHLLALGLSNRAMAENMVVSEGTIKTHIHNLLSKLGAQSRTQALARAKELGLLG